MIANQEYLIYYDLFEANLAHQDINIIKWSKSRLLLKQ
jgi:hypothetical protein